MEVININRNQFEEMVHSGKTVLVEFSAPWCVYCRRLAPSLESVAEEYKDTLVFTAVNIDDEPELAETEAIEVVPTLLIYHSGQTLGSIVAPESRAQLVAFIEETLQHRTQEVNNAQHIYDMIVVGGGPGGYIQIRNVKTGEESTLACDGVFVSVGRKPSTELMKDQIEIDPAGYIIADESTRTNIPGVFAVGDVRTKALRQVVTAVADGATAVHYAEEYLAGEM